MDWDWTEENDVVCSKENDGLQMGWMVEWDL